jgi:hypothetical protein
MCFRVIVNLESGNSKTGTMPVSMTDRNSCPPACGMREACYAKFGNLALHWNRMDQGAGMFWSDFIRVVKSMGPEVKTWRHNAAGDLPGRNNRLNFGKCMELARANCAGGYNRGGFTYTHYPVLGNSATAKWNRSVIRAMVAQGFGINLSADNLDMADRLKALGIAPVAVVLPVGSGPVISPAGNRVGVCPAVTRGTHCSRCRLCTSMTRNVIVGLVAHGVKKSRASETARGN